MNMLKRTVLLCVTMCLSLLGIGCNRKVELRLGVFVDSNWDVPGSEMYTIIDRVIERFEDAHPNIHVTYDSGIRKDDYSSRLMNAFLSGTEPDVFLILDEDFITLSSLGGLYSLDGKMEKDGIETDQYFSSAIHAGMYHGHCYALPLESNATMMFVNKTLLSQLGIDMPSNDWTLDDFLDICEQITTDTDGNGTIDVFGCYNYTWLDAVYGYNIDLFNEDGTKCTLDTAEVRSSISFIQKLQELNSGYQVTANMFDQGKVAFAPMTFAQYRTYKPYPWRIKKYLAFEWDVVAMPSNDNNSSASQVSTLLAGISSRSYNKSEAWMFLKELSFSKETQQDIMLYSQGLSVLKEVVSDSFISELLKEDMGDTMVDLSVLNDVMENGKKAGGFLKYDEVISMITSDVEDLIRNDDSDIELQLLRIQKSINRVLNQ